MEEEKEQEGPVEGEVYMSSIDGEDNGIWREVVIRWLCIVVVNLVAIRVINGYQNKISNPHQMRIVINDVNRERDVNGAIIGGGSSTAGFCKYRDKCCYRHLTSLCTTSGCVDIRRRVDILNMESVNLVKNVPTNMSNPDADVLQKLLRDVFKVTHSLFSVPHTQSKSRSILHFHMHTRGRSKSCI